MIDITKLAPAPWAWDANDGSMLTLGTRGDMANEVLSIGKCKECQKSGANCMWPDPLHAEAILLMRSDMDVMMRRKWFVMPQRSGFWVVCSFGDEGVIGHAFTAEHPLGLLTRADEEVTAMEKERA